jgi:hypothetical protein
VNAPLVLSTWLIKWINIKVDNWTKAHLRRGFRLQILRNQFGLIWSKLNPWVGRGFLLWILWCSQSGNHPENNLAKFCYILNMKLEKKVKKSWPFYIFGYLLELIITIRWSDFFFLQNLANLGHSLHPGVFFSIFWFSSWSGDRP